MSIADACPTHFDRAPGATVPPVRTRVRSRLLSCLLVSAALAGSAAVIAIELPSLIDDYTISE